MSCVNARLVGEAFPRASREKESTVFYETVSEINQQTNLFGGKIEIVIVMILSMDGSVENFLSDIV